MARFADLDTFRVEVDFPSGAGDGTYLLFDDTSRGLFDTGTFAPEGTFTDISEYVVSGVINRGTNDPDEVVPYKANAGTLSLTLRNDDARFDPTNLSGPYVSGGVSEVQPMRRIRVVANGVTLYYGFIDAWDLMYTNGGKAATTTVTATDGTKIISKYDGEAGSFVGSGELTGERINRVLDNAGWPTTDRNIDDGVIQVQSTSLADNAWTEVQLNNDTELGELYFDAEGRITFRNRGALLTEARSNTAQAVFGDTGDTDLRYMDVRLTLDSRAVRNLISIARNGGSAQVVEDTDSQAKYLVQKLTRTDLLFLADSDSLSYAQTLLYILKDTTTRFETVTIRPRYSPDELYPAILNRELGDRITVKLNPPGGSAIERDCFVRGISHSFSADAWDTTFTLQDSTSYAFMVFDHAELGRFDYNAFMGGPDLPGPIVS